VVCVCVCVCVPGQERPYKKSCNLTQHTGHLPAAKDDLSIYWRLARPELAHKWKSYTWGEIVLRSLVRRRRPRKD
jgi:hypothetical protein